MLTSLMRLGLLRLPAVTFCVAVAGLACFRFAVSSGTQSMAAHLNATNIDFACDSSSPSEALGLLRQKLRDKDPFFHECNFQFDVPQSPVLISMKVEDTPGDDCLKYVTELSQLHYRLHPRKIVVAPVGADTRDFFERTTDATTGWFRNAGAWTKMKLGLAPIHPDDPFAQPKPHPVNPFGL